jgi:phosphoglycolate phosphatase
LTASAVLSGRFNVVIFDYDGTLFDTRPAIVHCLRRSFEECGRRIPAVDAVADAARTGATLPDTMLQLDRALTRDHTALNELVVTYRKLYRDEGTALLRAFPGATEMLQQLHRGGTKSVVVSNKGIEAIKRSFVEAGLSPLIDFVVGDQPGIPKKPDPAIVTDLIVPRYAARSDEILIVGDTEVDILFARRTAVSSCWASYGYGESQRCLKLEPQYVISAITELPAIVLGADKGRPDRHVSCLPGNGSA